MVQYKHVLDHLSLAAGGIAMRKMVTYIIVLFASLLFVLSLTAALWDCKVTSPKENWGKARTIQNVKPIGYRMMAYVDRPIMRSGQTCKTYLSFKNVSKCTLKIESTTYVTNRLWRNGELYGEEIGDWQLHNAPYKLLPGEVLDVPYPRYQEKEVGFYGWQFNGYGVETNTITIYVLPSRQFCFALAAIAAFVVWRALLGINYRRRVKDC